MEMEHFMGLLIPILAIVMSLGLGMIAVVLDYRRKRAQVELVHKERLAAIEKGMEPPPLPDNYLGNGRRYKDTPAGMLRSGLVLVFVGAAVGAALYLTMPYNRQWAWGLIPLAVGVARLIGWKLSPKAEDGSGRPPQA